MLKNPAQKEHKIFFFWNLSYINAYGIPRNSVCARVSSYVTMPMLLFFEAISLLTVRF